MRRLNVLDLFSCGGGSVRGWQLAGAHVTAVDIDGTALEQNPAEERVQGDAIAFLKRHGHRFDFIGGSPPCQRWAAHGNRLNHPDLITPYRAAVRDLGVPYVIENVHSARRQLINPVTLCGVQFGLTAVDDDGTLLYLQRHRVFEVAGFDLEQRPHPHPKGVQWAGAYGGARRDKIEARTIRKGGYVPPNLDVIRALLGIPWLDTGVTSTTEKYLFEAIPPAYTESIGLAFRAQRWDK